MGVSLGVVGRKPINAVLGHPKKNMLLLLILAYLRRDTKGNNSITRKFFLPKIILLRVIITAWREFLLSIFFIISIRIRYLVSLFLLVSSSLLLLVTTRFLSLG
jgi:hypothetical protein